eukprot:1154264-Pelagomonas_calceolata.AAC.5
MPDHASGDFETTWNSDLTVLSESAYTQPCPTQQKKNVCGTVCGCRGTPYVYSLMQLHNIKLHVASSIDDTGQLSTPTSSPKLMTDVLQYNYAAGALSLPVECPEGGA